MSINELYEVMQETEMIRKARDSYEADVRTSVEKIASNKELDEEAVRDILFGVALKAERAGYAAGFRCAIALLLDCCVTG